MIDDDLVSTRARNSLQLKTIKVHVALVQSKEQQSKHGVACVRTRHATTGTQVSLSLSISLSCIRENVAQHTCRDRRERCAGEEGQGRHHVNSHRALPTLARILGGDRRPLGLLVGVTLSSAAARFRPGCSQRGAWWCAYFIIRYHYERLAKSLKTVDELQSHNEIHDEMVDGLGGGSAHTQTHTHTGEGH